MNDDYLKKIGGLIDQKLEKKLEQKLDEKLTPVNEKLDAISEELFHVHKLASTTLDIVKLN